MKNFFFLFFGSKLVREAIQMTGVGELNASKINEQNAGKMRLGRTVLKVVRVGPGLLIRLACLLLGFDAG